MPLGKLSKRQIQDAYSVLAHLSKRLSKIDQLDQGFILGESNRFYTLIPHDFGMKVPPLLDNPEIIKNKLKMLEDLREIELAYNILKQDLEADVNPLDQHYRQLRTQLQVRNYCVLYFSLCAFVSSFFFRSTMWSPFLHFRL